MNTVNHGTHHVFLTSVPRKGKVNYCSPLANISTLKALSLISPPFFIMRYKKCEKIGRVKRYKNKTCNVPPNTVSECQAIKDTVRLLGSRQPSRQEANTWLPIHAVKCEDREKCAVDIHRKGVEFRWKGSLEWGLGKWCKVQREEHSNREWEVKAVQGIEKASYTELRNQNLVLQTMESPLWDFKRICMTSPDILQKERARRACRRDYDRG